MLGSLLNPLFSSHSHPQSLSIFFIAVISSHEEQVLFPIKLQKGHFLFSHSVFSGFSGLSEFSSP